MAIRENSSTPSQAELLQPSSDLFADMAFLENIGFRLEEIYPADDPAVALLSGHGLHIRLDKAAQIPPATLHIRSDNAALLGENIAQITAPNGAEFHLKPRHRPLQQPHTQHSFEVRQLRDREPWVIGRAGMHYRDLIPNRLGGSIIASHIRIPKGGPVPDIVHYHTIGFQLIYCYRGWVKLVYEDQGPPFILHTGDCVTQPPEIRHQVLEASDMLEVIEIGVPAAHLTTIDHAMTLPTPQVRPERRWQGQEFCHSRLSAADWQPLPMHGLSLRDTGIRDATRGLADVHVLQAPAAVAATGPLRHGADIHFTFVMEGKMMLDLKGGASHQLVEGDAFVIPPGTGYRFKDCTEGMELLEVVVNADK